VVPSFTGGTGQNFETPQGDGNPTRKSVQNIPSKEIVTYFVCDPSLEFATLKERRYFWTGRILG